MALAASHSWFAKQQKSSRATTWESKPQSGITKSSLPSSTSTSTDQDREGTPWPAEVHQGYKCSTLANRLVTFGHVSASLVSPLVLQLISGKQRKSLYHKNAAPKAPLWLLFVKMVGKTNFRLLIKIPQQLADAEFPFLHSPQPGIQLLIMTGSKGRNSQTVAQ